MVQKVRLAVAPLATTVAIGFGFLILLWFISQTIWLWVVVLIALILASAMKPLVNLIQRPGFPPTGWHLPKGVAIFLVYLFLGLTLGVGAFVVGKLVVTEIATIAIALPGVGVSPLASVQELARSLNLPPNLLPSGTQLASVLRQLAAAVVASAASTIPDFVTFIVRFFIVLTLAAFLVIESDRALDFWVSLFPVPRREQVRDITTRMGRTMGSWMLGMGAQMVIIGTVSGLTAALLGLPGPALFGLLAALLELAPSLGQILMVIPAVALALLQSPVVALEAAIAFTIIAQIDSTILSPMVAGRAVQLSPILVVTAIPIGLTLYGGLGAILSIPVAAALQIFVQEIVLPWLHHLQGAPSEPIETPHGEHEERAA